MNVIKSVNQFCKAKIKAFWVVKYEKENSSEHSAYFVIATIESKLTFVLHSIDNFEKNDSYFYSEPKV